MASKGELVATDTGTGVSDTVVVPTVRVKLAVDNARVELDAADSVSITV